MRRLERGVNHARPGSQLTSKPCFSDGTHTSLLAAQSAWLAPVKTEVPLEVGEPGITPDVRKRVTSLTPPPVGLDMVLLALLLKGERRGREKGEMIMIMRKRERERDREKVQSGSERQEERFKQHEDKKVLEVGEGWREGGER